MLSGNPSPGGVVRGFMAAATLVFALAGLLVRDAQQVPLPLAQVGIVLGDEEQQILLRLERHAA